MAKRLFGKKDKPVNKYFKYLLLLSFCLICPDIFAGVFDVVPTDKSKEYLGIIFGGSVGTVSLGGGGNPLLSRMFERFNFIIVMIGVLIMSYIGVVSAVNTAREGEAMGKKFSLWVPLRALFGMSMMLPSPGTGYSFIQMTVMWIVLNGVGAANSIWEVVLDQLGSGVQAVGTIKANWDDTAIDGIIHDVMLASTCRDYFNNQSSLDIIKNYGQLKLDVIYGPPTISNLSMTRSLTVNVGIPKPPAGKAYLATLCGQFTITSTIYPAPTSTSIGGSGSAGGVNVNTGSSALDWASSTFGSTQRAGMSAAGGAVAYGTTYNPDNLNKRLEIKVNGLKAVFDTVQSATQSILSGYIQNDTPAPGYVYTARDAYKGQLINLIGLGVPKPTGDLSSKIRALKSIGWIHAGNYYYAMTKASTTPLDLDAVKTPTRAIAGSDDTVIPAKVEANALGSWKAGLTAELPSTELKTRLNNALGYIDSYWNNDKSVGTPELQFMGTGDPGTGNKFVDAIVKGISGSIRKPIMNFFQAQLTKQDDDPLISMGKFGWQLMMAGELATFGMLILSAAITLGSSWGRCLSAFGYFTDMLIGQLFPMLFGLLVLLWTTGATLGVYVPLVPYMIFTATAIGWMIAVIEAVVGAPIIALGLVQPGGEELGQIKGALGILANIFLRPTLMLFGFVIAGALLRAILTMVNNGFVNAVEEATQQRSTLFSIFPVLGLYTFFVIGVVNKSFSLIYELPNKILRFMGISPESGEPGELVKEAKGGFDQGAATSQEAQKGMYDKGREKVGKAGKDAKDAQSAKDAAKAKEATDAHAKKPSPTPAGGAKSSSTGGGAPSGGSTPPPGI
jgi:defect-in-organelle-trafficking protein DotA